MNEFENMTREQKYEHAKFLLNRISEILEDVDDRIMLTYAEAEHLGDLGLDYANASYDILSD